MVLELAKQIIDISKNETKTQLKVWFHLVQIMVHSGGGGSGGGVVIVVIVVIVCNSM